MVCSLRSGGGRGWEQENNGGGAAACNDDAVKEEEAVWTTWAFFSFDCDLKVICFLLLWVDVYQQSLFFFFFFLSEFERNGFNFWFFFIPEPEQRDRNSMNGGPLISICFIQYVHNSQEQNEFRFMSDVIERFFCT